MIGYNPLAIMRDCNLPLAITAWITLKRMIVNSFYEELHFILLFG